MTTYTTNSQAHNYYLQINNHTILLTLYNIADRPQMGVSKQVHSRPTSRENIPVSILVRPGLRIRFRLRENVRQAKMSIREHAYGAEGGIGASTLM
jgi:hypothetical protein